MFSRQGKSKFSYCYLIELLSFLVPSLPPGVTALMVDSTSIKVTLLPLSSEFAHGILKEYLVKYRRVDEPLSADIVRSLQVNQSSLNLTDLNEFTYYSIQASATTSKGEGPKSAPFYVKTDEDGTPLLI